MMAGGFRSTVNSVFNKQTHGVETNKSYQLINTATKYNCQNRAPRPDLCGNNTSKVLEFSLRVFLTTGVTTGRGGCTAGQPQG